MVPKRKQKDFFNGKVGSDGKIFGVCRTEGRPQTVLVGQAGPYCAPGRYMDHTSPEGTAVVRIFGRYALTTQEST